MQSEFKTLTDSITATLKKTIDLLGPDGAKHRDDHYDVSDVSQHKLSASSEVPPGDVLHDDMILDERFDVDDVCAWHSDFDDGCCSLHSSDLGSDCGSGCDVPDGFDGLDGFLHDILHDPMKLKIYSFSAPRRRSRGRRPRPPKSTVTRRSERPTRAEFRAMCDAAVWQS